MCKKLFLLISVVLLLGLAATANAGYISSSNISATPSSSYSAVNYPVEGTFNGVGLDTADIHHYAAKGSWFNRGASDSATPSPSGTTGYTWVCYKFDQNYKLGEMWVWNHGSTVTARSFKTCLVQYTSDGSNWSTLGGGTVVFPKPTSVNHSHEVVLDFAMADANQVLITATDSWGNNYCGLDEVRFNLPNYQASSPYPTNEQRFVPTDTKLIWKPGVIADKHDVYLGQSWADVNDGTAYIDRRDANEYSLALSGWTRYYWRIDEVNAPDANWVWPGEIWTFATTFDFGGFPNTEYVAPGNILATASSEYDSRSERMPIAGTCNGAGLIPPDFTTYSAGLGGFWLNKGSSDSGVPSPSGTTGYAWCAYEFDQAYQLNNAWLWNSNSNNTTSPPWENPTRALKDITIQYSSDGTNWTTAYTGELEKPPYWVDEEGEPVKPPVPVSLIADLDGNPVKYLVITAANTWGAVYASFGEIRFWLRGNKASDPDPVDGETGVARNAAVSWLSGLNSDGHDVYFGDNAAAVSAASDPNTLPGRGRQVVGDTDYDPPGDLDLGKAYYWRIDEVNGVSRVAEWKGDVWSFIAKDGTDVDNFNTYNDTTPGAVYDTWTDGWSMPHSSGSTINVSTTLTPDGPTYGGSAKSLVFWYDNDGTYTQGNGKKSPYYSEIEVPTSSLACGNNWTQDNVVGLRLYYFGDPCNQAIATDVMYVALEDGNGKFASVEANDVSGLTESGWHEWAIALQDYVDANSLTLSNISKVYIGFGDRDNPVIGKAGRMFIDEIQLIVAGCVDRPTLEEGNLNGDCKVDYADLDILTNNWLESGMWP